MLKGVDLSGFSGTQQYHSWSVLFPHVYLTDGAQYVAEHGGQHGAFWLMDLIASYQPALRRMDFQVWRLEVDTKNACGILFLEDGDDSVLFHKHIHLTDFDIPVISLWVEYGQVANETCRVILLPSEH